MVEQFHAIVTSGIMVEYNNGRLNTIVLGPIGPTPLATKDDICRYDFFHERSRTLWNFIMDLMERNNYGDGWPHPRSTLGAGNFVSVCNWTPTSTQLSLAIFRGLNKYRPMGGDVLRLWIKGR